MHEILLLIVLIILFVIVIFLVILLRVQVLQLPSDGKWNGRDVCVGQALA
jgi:ABC-type cobalt transport system substrate-binding protein